MDFEALLENFYQSLDLDGAMIVDVGAHTGRHTLPLARKAGSGGFVYAFEPIPSIRASLCARLADAKLNNVAVFPYALAQEGGIRDFHFIPNLPEESGLKRRHIYNAPPETPVLITVNTFRLDDLAPAAHAVDFVKMDVEGGELDVLRGARATLARSLPIVAFECGAASFLGYHQAPGEIFTIFSSLGYGVYSITGKPIVNAEASAWESHAQNFWDYIALPPGKESLARNLPRH